jgi:hypothetical protein
VRRYILHLLPDEERRRAYDDLRARVAAAIGWNKALDYPCAHVTLVWAIQDEPDDPAPIDAAALAALLDAHRDHAPIVLPVRPGLEDIEHHLLLPLAASPALTDLRAALFEAAREIAAGAVEHGHTRAERVREQTWPHLTLAQEIDGPRWRAALEIVRAAGPWLTEPVICTELALVARDLAADEQYRILHRAPLRGVAGA